MTMPGAMGLESFAFPSFYTVHRKWPDTHLHRLDGAVDHALAGTMARSGIASGDTVAVAVGSRGIAGIETVVGRLCACIADAGATPVLVPAMGSHGGATAEGQTRVLDRLGITAAASGVCVHAAMDTTVVASVLDGVPVHFATDALRCDHTILVNRIKPHTKFKGPVESGLYKMMVVGLGKHAGARVWHQWAIRYGFYPLLETMGNAVLAAANIRFGLAVVENAYHRPMVVEAVPAADMWARETALLAAAKTHLPRLPFRTLDGLIVGRAGKDISGAGMDPNVTGRAQDLKEEGFDGILAATRLAVLDLTEKTGGNAIGIGYADFITRRVRDKVDTGITQINALTSLSIRKGAVPIHLETDAAAIHACLTTIGPVPPEQARMAIIRDTRDVATFWASAGLGEELAALPDVTVSEARPLEFDAEGGLVWPACRSTAD